MHDLPRRITLMHRIRRGLSAWRQGRISGDTFDALLVRWQNVERETA